MGDRSDDADGAASRADAVDRLERVIDTRATRYFGMGTEEDWRTPEIVSDTVLEILGRDPSSFNGNAVYDEEFLREAGVEDFWRYNLTEGDPAPMSAQLFDPGYERPE